MTIPHNAGASRDYSTARGALRAPSCPPTRVSSFSVTANWHKKGTVICSAQLCHTVKEDHRHVLVLALHKAGELELF